MIGSPVFVATKPTRVSSESQEFTGPQVRFPDRRVDLHTLVLSKSHLIITFVQALDHALLGVAPLGTNEHTSKTFTYPSRVIFGYRASLYSICLILGGRSVMSPSTHSCLLAFRWDARLHPRLFHQNP